MLDGGNDDGARPGREHRTQFEHEVRARLRASRRHRDIAWPQAAVAVGTLLLLGGILGFLMPKKVEVADQYASVIAMIFGLLTLAFSVYQAVSEPRTGNRPSGGGVSASPSPRVRKFSVFMTAAVGSTAATCGVGGFISGGPGGPVSPTVDRSRLEVITTPILKPAVCGYGIKIDTTRTDPPATTPPAPSWQQSPSDSLTITPEEVEDRFVSWAEGASAIPVGVATSRLLLRPVGEQPVELDSIAVMPEGELVRNPNERILKTTCRGDHTSPEPFQLMHPEKLMLAKPGGTLRVELSTSGVYPIRFSPTRYRIPAEGLSLVLQVSSVGDAPADTLWTVSARWKSSGDSGTSISRLMAVASGGEGEVCRWAANGKPIARQPTACPTFRP